MQARQLTIDAVQESDVTLAGGPVRANCVAWSPDGRMVAVTTGGVLSKGPLLIVAVANGQVQSKIESQGLMLGYPAWSPNGERLAFTSATVDYAVKRIDTFDLRSRVRSKLVDVPSQHGAENLVYSPDGRELLFDVLANGEQIFAYDGSHLRRLVAGWSPAWHPDRRSLTFVHGNSVYILGL
jgi:Tol biopolymer transport system component